MSVLAGTAEPGASTATPAAAIATTETRRNVRTQGIVICMSRGRSPEPHSSGLVGHLRSDFVR